jgi:hypothetical protein
VPYVKNINDGEFFIDETDFVNNYYYLTVNHVKDSYYHSYYEVLNDSGAARTFTFTVPSTQEVYVSVDFYDSRMYA